MTNAKNNRTLWIASLGGFSAFAALTVLSPSALAQDVPDSCYATGCDKRPYDGRKPIVPPHMSADGFDVATLYMYKGGEKQSMLIGIECNDNNEPIVTAHWDVKSGTHTIFSFITDAAISQLPDPITQFIATQTIRDLTIVRSVRVDPPEGLCGKNSTVASQGTGGSEVQTATAAQPLKPAPDGRYHSNGQVWDGAKWVREQQPQYATSGYPAAQTYQSAAVTTTAPTSGYAAEPNYPTVAAKTGRVTAPAASDDITIELQ